MKVMIEAMTNELAQEGATTRRMLERVPADKLAWRPHEKSMTLGQLALHVATIPGDLSRLAQLDEFDAAMANFDSPAPLSHQEVIAGLDKNLAAGSEYLRSLTPETAGAAWRLNLRGQELFTMPRIALLRSLLLNHWYHHRGQLSVYLRLLDVPVPVTYGRTADENPFV